MYFIDYFFKNPLVVSIMSNYGISLEKGESRNISLSSCKTYVQVRNPQYGQSITKHSGPGLAKDYDYTYKGTDQNNITDGFLCGILWK